MTAPLDASAAVLRSHHGPFELERITVAAPAPDEILVKIAGSGICHTDLSARDGALPFPLPGVLGHEGSGVVAEVGDRVAGFAVGDHVVLSGAYCGECPTCLDGQVVYCPTFPIRSRAGRRADGSPTMYDREDRPLYGTFVGQSSFSTHVLVRAVNAVRVRHDVPIELLGPLGCGVMTGAGAVMDTLRPTAGSSLVVFGLGGVGMSAVVAGRLVGCNAVIAVDLNHGRLELAKDLGATAVVAADGDVVGAVRELTGGGADFAIDATGVAAVGATAIETTHGQGTTLLLGAPAQGAELRVPWTSILRGRSVRGAIMGGANPRRFIPRIVDLIAQGRFPLERMVTYFDFDDIGAAVAALENGDVIKPVLRM